MQFQKEKINFDYLTVKQMNYHPHFQQTHYKEDPRMVKLKQDNIQLQKALQQLNECYQEKVSLLEEQLKKSKQREQTLLQWKSSYIDKELFKNSKYHEQLQKMIAIIQQLARNYQKQSQNFSKQLQQKQHLLEDLSKQLQHKQNLLEQLKNQNLTLKQQKQYQQKEIQSLVQKYLVEIERLKTQLKELKDEISYQENQLQEHDFSIHHQLGNWQSDAGSCNTNDFSMHNQLANSQSEGSYNGNDSRVEINEQDEQEQCKSYKIQGEDREFLKDISNQPLQVIKEAEKEKNDQSSHQISLLKGQLVC